MTQLITTKDQYNLHYKGESEDDQAWTFTIDTDFLEKQESSVARELDFMHKTTKKMDDSDITIKLAGEHTTEFIEKWDGLVNTVKLQKRVADDKKKRIAAPYIAGLIGVSIASVIVEPEIGHFVIRAANKIAREFPKLKTHYETIKTIINVGTYTASTYFFYLGTFTAYKGLRNCIINLKHSEQKKDYYSTLRSRLD